MSAPPRQPRIIIAALAPNRVICDGHDMPWNVPEEYHQYLRFIDGQTVIMDCGHYKKFGADLTSDFCIVVSQALCSGGGVCVRPTLREALERADALGRTIFLAGGDRIYTEGLAEADEMYLSWIKGDFEGSMLFPEFSEADWELRQRKYHPDFVFTHYVRRQA